MKQAVRWSGVLDQESGAWDLVLAPFILMAWKLHLELDHNHVAILII